MEDFIVLLARKYINGKINISPHVLWLNGGWVYLTKLAKQACSLSNGGGGSRAGFMGMGPVESHMAILRRAPCMIHCSAVAC